jgi:hypothetical protein
VIIGRRFATSIDVERRTADPGANIPLPMARFLTIGSCFARPS